EDAPLAAGPEREPDAALPLPVRPERGLDTEPRDRRRGGCGGAGGAHPLGKAAAALRVEVLHHDRVVEHAGRARGRHEPALDPRQRVGALAHPRDASGERERGVEAGAARGLIGPEEAPQREAALLRARVYRRSVAADPLRDGEAVEARRVPLASGSGTAPATR